MAINIEEIIAELEYSPQSSSKLSAYLPKLIVPGQEDRFWSSKEKIVVVVNGSIIDYCIDLRKKSKTFAKNFKFILNENSILYIPAGFAHGYFGKKSENKIIYLLSNYRYIKYENGLKYEIL